MTEWSQVPALVENLGTPEVFGETLRHRVQYAYAELARLRGQVTRPEDVFDLVRRIGHEHEQFKAYQRVFTEAVKLLHQLLEEELVEAVGEQDGIPNQGLTVPDAEGDIRLSLDTPRVYSIDMAQVWSVVANRLADDARVTEVGDPVPWTVYALVIMLSELGKFEPQVSKIRAYAATLARAGLDKEAAIVSSAITENRPYKGVKFERTDPK